MEACQGCEGEDTQGEGPCPRSMGVVFNPVPWDSPSPSRLLLADAGFCSWLGCSPVATSASKGLVSASYREAQSKGMALVIRSSGSCATAVGLMCA